jgi:hypothetical protein
MFGDHEKRQFLESLGPFILVSVEDKQPAIAAQILAEGYTVTDPETQEQSKWYVAGYYVRDDSVVYIMTPTPMRDSAFFASRGLRVDLENEWGNSFKVGKYMKRLYSHHRKFMQGQVIKENGPVILVRLDNGRVLSVKYADHGKLTDGMNLVSSHCMKMMGLKQDEGHGLRITALSPKGFSKGHAIVLRHLQHDLVLFNSKKLLYGDKFTFGMDWLHDAGAVYTDIQSYVNFRLVDIRTLLSLSDTYMESVMDSLEDTEKLRRMLQFYKLETHMTRDEDGDPVFVEKEKDWTLLNALRHGVDIQSHPALVRRYFNLFTKTVMNCETNMRTPIPSTIGGARYAMVDPSIFDMWGDPTLDGELHGNTVYCGGGVGDVAFHRQPNAHRGEHHIAQAVASNHLKNMDSGVFMFLSREMGEPVLGKLGGGDYDDRLVYYTDPIMVNHFRKLELDPYPVVTKQPKQNERPKFNVFEHRMLRKPVYDRDQLLVMLDQMKEQSVSIGYVVNAIMQDTCITDHKTQMMNFISELPKEPKNIMALEWLKQYPGNVLADPASRLEDTIDAVKKTGSDLKDIGRQVREWNATYQVVSKFFTRGGKFEGRVPQSRRASNSYPVVVTCSIDHEIEEVHQHRKDLEDIVTRNSYQMMKPIPEEILTYPTIEPHAQQLAVAIRQNYYEQWNNLKKEIPNTNDAVESKASVEAYNKIDAALVKQYGNHPLILDAMVHLYIMVYENRKPDAPLQDDGTYKKFPDGLLWGTHMSALTIKMLEMVGLAGRYVPVEFDSEAKRYKYQPKVDAVVENNVVKQEGTNVILGTLNPSPYPDGHITIEKGLVKVPAKDAYPYQGPEPKWMTLSVVNGWDEKLRAAEGADQKLFSLLIKDLATWKAQADKKVKLVPYVFTNPTTGEDEHAVRVMLDGAIYGHITRKDATYVTDITDGWLARGTGRATMQVIVEEK